MFRALVLYLVFSGLSYSLCAHVFSYKAKQDYLVILYSIVTRRGIVTLFGNFIKSLKVSSHQLNFKTNDLVLLLTP